MKTSTHASRSLNRRSFLTTSAAAATFAGVVSLPTAATAAPEPILRPPSTGKSILLSCKLGMIASKAGDKQFSIVERLQMAKEAGFDGVDFDEAGNFTPEQASEAVMKAGIFAHNAINHAHWGVRLTDPSAEVRAKAVSNLEHCVRVSHAIRGSGVLIVVGRGSDGPAEEIEERCRQEIRKVIPLAASMGQQILFENVWNQMMYDHDKGPEQSADRFVKFVDSFNSAWVGMYYDIGNHWKYGQPKEWIHAFGRRAVKLDIKGFSRAKNKFVDITSPEDDVPWGEVRKALNEVGFTGWATAEVGGGETKRLTLVREQMQRALHG
ncbi:MAG: sugar phosphate isomerase/epimerase [Verrucomicrobia bacterium]|nr:sugar phosphate isomerase/epimerase [Verrucomicrobiota bacterium]